MKIAVVLNGISLAKDVFYNRYLPTLRRHFTVDVHETLSVHDAISLAAKAVQKRYDVIIAAGGDGTINQVVNGMLKEEAVKLPLLAILPLGSGNDFARTLRQDNSPETFTSRLKQLSQTEIDVGEVYYSVSPPANGVTSIQDKRYFVNVADVGMGPPVVRGVLESGRAFGSAVAYYVSIVKTFFTYKPMLLHARSASWTWSGKMRTFAIGNAKYYGNGLCIAPEAVLNDGVFNVFACGAVSVLDFIVQSLPLKQGKKIKHSQVSYLQTEEVELSSADAIEIEADGEIIGWLPARVKISPLKLKILS